MTSAACHEHTDDERAGSDAPAADAPLAGVADASAQRTFERLSEARRIRVRAEHPYLGGLILRHTNEPAHTLRVGRRRSR